MTSVKNYDYSIVDESTPNDVLEDYIQNLPNIVNPHFMTKMFKSDPEKMKRKVVKQINEASWNEAIETSLKQQLGLGPAMDSRKFIDETNNQLDEIEEDMAVNKENLPAVKASIVQLKVLKYMFELKMKLNSAIQKVALDKTPYYTREVTTPPTEAKLNMVYNKVYQSVDNRFEEMGYTNVTPEDKKRLEEARRAREQDKRRQLFGSKPKNLLKKKKKTPKRIFKRLESSEFEAALEASEKELEGGKVKRREAQRKMAELKSKYRRGSQKTFILSALPKEARELYDSCQKQIKAGVSEQKLAQAKQIEINRNQLFGMAVQEGETEVKAQDLLNRQVQTLVDTSSIKERMDTLANAQQQQMDMLMRLVNMNEKELEYDKTQEQAQQQDLDQGNMTLGALDDISTQQHVADKMLEGVSIGVDRMLSKMRRWETGAMNRSKKLLDRMWTTRKLDMGNGEEKRYIDPTEMYDGAPWSALVGLESYFWIINDFIAAIGKYLGLARKERGNPEGWLDTFWQAMNVHLTVMITQAKTFVKHIMHLAEGAKNPLNYTLKDCFRIQASILAIAFQIMFALINMFILLKVTAVISMILRYINTASQWATGVNVIPEWLIGTLAKPLNIGSIVIEKVIIGSLKTVVSLIYDGIMLTPRILAYIFFGWDYAPDGFPWWGNNMLFWLTKQVVNAFAETLGLSRWSWGVWAGDGILKAKDGIAYLLNFKETMGQYVEKLDGVATGVEKVSNTTGQIYNKTTNAIKYVKDKMRNPFRLYRDDPFTHVHLATMLGMSLTAFKELDIPHLQQQKDFILRNSVTASELMWLRDEIRDQPPLMLEDGVKLKPDGTQKWEPVEKFPDSFSKPKKLNVRFKNLRY